MPRYKSVHCGDKWARCDGFRGQDFEGRIKFLSNSEGKVKK